MTTLRNTIVFIFVAWLAASPTVHSAEKKEKTEAVTRSTYKSLEKIQTMMSENQNAQALTELKTLYTEIEKGTMDEAVVAQMMGYSLMTAEKYKKAIPFFITSLETNLMPEATNNNMRFMLAQLLVNEGDYKQALIYAQAWYNNAEEVKPSQIMFIANIYVQSKQYKEAIPYIKKAIAQADKPKESWYQLMVGCYYEMKQYSSATTVLKDMLGIWPDKKNYWEQLAGIYLKLDKEADALAVLDLSWRNGVLDKESSIKTLVQYAVSFGIPERAARILDQAIAETKLPEDVKTLQVLASAWTQAKEVDKAIASYQRLVDAGADGKAMTRLARLYIEKEDWANAQLTLKESLTRENVDPAQAYLLLGVSYIKDNNFESAKTNLKKAAAYKKTKSQANAWLNFANQKLQSQNRMARIASN